jgi:hypothetical protein
VKAALEGSAWDGMVEVMAKARDIGIFNADKLADLQMIGRRRVTTIMIRDVTMADLARAIWMRKLGHNESVL